MRVVLEPEWLGSDWQWCVGVLRGQNLSEQECQDLLKEPSKDNIDRLAWKLGSTVEVDRLFAQGLPGITLNPLRSAPPALPQRDWLYYEVNRNCAAWHSVQRTQTLAMRLRDKIINNRQQLQGQRELVVTLRGKQATLRFSLFALPIPANP